MTSLIQQYAGRLFSRLLLVAALVFGLALYLLDSVSHPSPRVVAASLGPRVRINQVMAGANGLSKIQFIELEAANSSQKCWGPAQPGSTCFTGVTETTGRDMLLFFDANGNQTGRYVFSHDPGGPANTVLIATSAFAALPGAPTPDFLITSDVIPESGQVCWRGNPDNRNAAPANKCMAYGAFPGPQQNNAAFGDPVAGPFTGPANGVPFTAPGVLVTSTLQITDTLSLSRTVNTFDAQFNADFVLSLNPIPHNTAGQTFVFTTTTQVVQGENLFENETFLGNGRTCSSCHVEQDSYGLSPETVASLAPSDPLFVAEYDLNMITLSAASFPSDLRGPITATNGLTATQLYGTLDAYQVYGGSAALVGQVVTDAQGNSGTVATFTLGDLSPQNGRFSGLEDPILMRGGRALILENIDNGPAVMRHSPNLINVGFTVPYGQSAISVFTLQDFSAGALAQHGPRRLARVPGVDFRLQTLEELDALTAFMNSIQVGASHNQDLDFFSTTEAQKRGRNLFFGPAACFECHRGPLLDLSIDKDRSDFFVTGVSNQAINTTDGLPLERQQPSDTTNTREFNSRQLWGLRNLTSLMHEGSSHNLLQAVQFYTTTVFETSRHGSQAFADMIPLTDQHISDLTAFLAALVDQPFDFTRTTANFGSQPPNAGATAPQTILITNTGTLNLAINGVAMNGAGATNFVITHFPPPGAFSPGQSRSIGVAFAPTQPGLFCATLEFTVTTPSSADTWPVGVPVTGTGTGGAISAPTISLIPDQVVFLNKPAEPLSFTVDEPGATANCLTVTGVSSNPTLVPDTNLVFGGTDSTNRQMAAASVFGQFGTTTITVTVSDGLQTASTSFAMTVLSIGPPNKTPVPTQTKIPTDTPTATSTPTPTSTRRPPTRTPTP